MRYLYLNLDLVIFGKLFFIHTSINFYQNLVLTLLIPVEYDSGKSRGHWFIKSDINYPRSPPNGFIGVFQLFGYKL